MSRFQEFCDAVLNNEWNQDLEPHQKGKLALALLAQEELFDKLMDEAVENARFLDRVNR